MPNDKTARQILEQPFDQSLIKQRPASYGGSLSYVEGHEYIKRLNQALDGAWSFEITAHQITDNECIVIGKLTADGVVKMAFGGSEIKRKRETNEIICLADDLKAAATDALKKGATLLGLGLHLYGGDSAANNGKPANGDPGGAKPANTASGNGNGSAAPSNGNGNGNHAQSNGGNGEDKSRLSSKQLGMILALARERSISREKLQGMVSERYNRGLEFLSRSEASFFIGELQAAARPPYHIPPPKARQERRRALLLGYLRRISQWSQNLFPRPLPRWRSFGKSRTFRIARFAVI